MAYPHCMSGRSERDLKPGVPTTKQLKINKTGRKHCCQQPTIKVWEITNLLYHIDFARLTAMHSRQSNLAIRGKMHRIRDHLILKSESLSNIYKKVNIACSGLWKVILQSKKVRCHVYTCPILSCNSVYKTVSRLPTSSQLSSRKFNTYWFSKLRNSLTSWTITPRNSPMN